jgi:hypothetical protein
VSADRQARAGLYARDRYRRGLKAYRRRMRAPLLVVVAPMFLFFWGVALSQTLDAWSVAAGAVAASAIGLIVFVRDDPPQHVANWRRGAEGERKTEKALRSLERSGWSVEHDLQREGRANLDHVVKGPRGVFLLETKNLAGTISFEDGCLTARQFDDPDEVYRYRTLAGRVRGQAMELSTRIGQSTGRRPWVNAVVVVWGHFPEGHIERDKITYINGEKLADWIETGEIGLV